MKVESTGVCPECQEVFNIKANRGSCPSCLKRDYWRLDSVVASFGRSHEILKKLVFAVNGRLFTITNKEHDTIVNEAIRHIKEVQNE